MRHDHHIAVLWRGPRQDISRGIHVAVEYASALAPMNASVNRLWHTLAAFAAILACVLCANEYNATASGLSLAGENQTKLAPASAKDTAGKPAVPYHIPNGKAFHRDCSVSADKGSCDFVVHVLAGIADFGVKPRDTPFDKSPAIASEVASIQCAVAPPQFGQLPFEEFTVANGLALGCRDERLDAKINPDLAVSPYGRRGLEFDYKKHEPLIGFALNNDSLNNTVLGQRPMPANPHAANVCDTQLAFAGDCEAAAIRGTDGERLEFVGRFESRITTSLLAFHLGKEPLECALGAFHGSLCRPCGDSLQVWAAVPASSEPSALLQERPISAGGFPAEKFSVNDGIVESPVRLKHDAEFTFLIGIREQAVFEATNHNGILPENTDYRESPPSSLQTQGAPAPVAQGWVCYSA